MGYQEKEKEWYTLKEACAAKNLNYRTALNRKELRPNGGEPDGIIAGRDMWRAKTIEEWIGMTDEDLPAGAEKEYSDE